MTEIVPTPKEFRPELSSDVFVLNHLVGIEMHRIQERGEEPGSLISGVAEKLTKSIWSIVEAHEHAPGASLTDNEMIATFNGEEVELLKHVLWKRVYHQRDGAWEQRAAMRAYCSMPQNQ